MKKFLTTLLAATFLATPVYAQDEEKKPNVIVIMVDNLGWGELGVYGGGELRGAPTPRLDQLASEGLRLLNFNVEPQCTPSRSAFMTGRHPIRSGTTKVVWGMLYGMTSWEKTMPELFSEQGYVTGMFGKWHLGDTPGRFPTDQGFDVWYGIANTTDEAMYSSQFQYDPEVGTTPFIQEVQADETTFYHAHKVGVSPIMESEEGKVPVQVKAYDISARRIIDSELTERAIEFMEKSVDANLPFFAFVPLTQPHMPTLPHPDFDGVTGNGHYADVMTEIDYRTGQLLDAIDELGIRDNTIVIWMSDNGPEFFYPWHGTAGPWKGTYFTIWEGSLRVPFLIRWPGKIEAGRTSNEIVHMTDLLPSLARVAGYEVPKDRIIDGVDQLDFILGNQEQSNREGFIIYNGDEVFGYKWRNWKLHLIELEKMDGHPERLNVPKIYNLITDPKEEYNVGPDATWVLPVLLKKIVNFKKTFAKEPPIPLGTPDPLNLDE